MTTTHQKNTTEDFGPAVAGNRHGIWRTRRYDLDHGPDIARYVARHKYAWPGGYELFAITDDGGTLCHRCCFSEYYAIRTAWPGNGWNVTGMFSDAEADEHVYCDHCGRC